MVRRNNPTPPTHPGFDEPTRHHQRIQGSTNQPDSTNASSVQRTNPTPPTHPGFNEPTRLHQRIQGSTNQPDYFTAFMGLNHILILNKIHVYTEWSQSFSQSWRATTVGVSAVHPVSYSWRSNWSCYFMRQQTTSPEMRLTLHYLGGIFDPCSFRI